MPTKKIASKIKNNINNVYAVIYEPTYYEFSQGISQVIKVFKSKKDATLYTDTRNFEFQVICMNIVGGGGQYEHYVLTDIHKDYAVTIFDLKSAYSYICDEFYTHNQKNTAQIFSIISKINPFKYKRVSFCEALE
jgi:hypothetical protein